MVDTKISDLTALTGAGTATGDLLPIDDVSATTTKSISVAQLIVALQALGIGTGLAASTVTTLGITGNVTITDVDIVLTANTGTKIGTATTQKLSFYNATPIARPSAYTQTYATADKTHANPTAASVVTTGAALASYGYSQAQADSIPVAINALVADMADIKQLANSIIDDLQALGLVG